MMIKINKAQLEKDCLLWTTILQHLTWTHIPILLGLYFCINWLTLASSTNHPYRIHAMVSLPTFTIEINQSCGWNIPVPWILRAYFNQQQNKKTCRNSSRWVTMPQAMLALDIDPWSKSGSFCCSTTGQCTTMLSAGANEGRSIL